MRIIIKSAMKQIIAMDSIEINNDINYEMNNNVNNKINNETNENQFK